MKVVFDIDPSATNRRTDAIVIDESEFPARDEGLKYVFRSDDRPPSEIFSAGFTKRVRRLTLHGTAVEASELFNALSWGRLLGKSAAVAGSDGRTMSYTLKETEVVFRPSLFDMQQETCVSMTRTHKLCPLFPLNNKPVTYIYLSKLPVKYLLTSELQARGTSTRLQESLEVTCNQIVPGLIAGAAKVERTKTGEAASAVTNYRITEWYRNDGGSAVRDDEWGRKKFRKAAKGPVEEEGTLTGGGGFKDEAAGQADDILRLGVEAVLKVCKIQGGFLRGSTKQPAVGSADGGTSGHRRRKSLDG